MVMATAAMMNYHRCWKKKAVLATIDLVIH